MPDPVLVNCKSFELGEKRKIEIPFGIKYVKFSDTRFFQTMTWTLLAFGYAVLFTTYWSGSLFTDPSRPYHVLETSLYAALNHVVFALALSCIMWSHIFGTKSELLVVCSG